MNESRHAVLLAWLLGLATGMAVAIMLGGSGGGGGWWEPPDKPVGPLVMEDLRTH